MGLWMYYARAAMWRLMCLALLAGCNPWAEACPQDGTGENLYNISGKFPPDAVQAAIAGQATAVDSDWGLYNGMLTIGFADPARQSFVVGFGCNLSPGYAIGQPIKVHCTYEDGAGEHSDGPIITVLVHQRSHVFWQDPGTKVGTVVKMDFDLHMKAVAQTLPWIPPQSVDLSIDATGLHAEGAWINLVTCQ